MKKGVVIVMAVAIIGVLGVYGKSHSTSANASSPASSSQSSVTSSDSGSVAGDNTTNMPTASGSYKDGTYTGITEDNPYGQVQVAVVISGGKITNVNFLRMPGPDGHSREVTAFAQPLLEQETLNKQSAHIDFVSGATQTSESYERSLQAALDQAA